jgi:catechol 2,3-dioxygenase-like lactoylglutathione lyase family enzyme
MTVTHLDHLNLTVRDFEETAAWYGRVFGFEVVERETDAHGRLWGVLRAGDALLCVYEHPEFRFEDNDERRGRHAHGINHFGLRIADREAWEATMAREGITPDYGGPVSWPHSTAWYVADPTGYEIEVALWDEGAPRFGQ